MKQTGLIERVVEALGLDDGYARGKHTPAETKPLVKDEDDVAATEGFSCWDIALSVGTHSIRHYLCRQLLC
jgi:hypothetical protein